MTEPDLKSLLVRMDQQLKNQVQSTARAAGMSVNSFMCEAAKAYIAAVNPSPGTTPDDVLHNVRAAYSVSMLSNSNQSFTAATNPYNTAIDKLGGNGN